MMRYTLTNPSITSMKNAAVSRVLVRLESHTAADQSRLADNLLDVAHSRSRAGKDKEAYPVYQEAVDGHWDVRELYSVADRVVARWVGSGTHVGELMDVSPTGRPIEVDAISIFRVEGGKIAEEWTVWDALGLLQQVGAVPAPA